MQLCVETRKGSDGAEEMGMGEEWKGAGFTAQEPEYKSPPSLENPGMTGMP